MRHLKILTTIVLLFFLSGVVHAQVKAWSLEECIHYGMEHHISTRMQSNNVKISEQKARESLSAYLPQVNTSLTLDDNLKRQTSIIPAGYIGPDEVKVQFGTQYSSVASVQFDQVIYDQSLITGLKANKYQIEQARLTAGQNKEVVAYNIATGYYQVFVYHKQLDLLFGNIENYKQQLKLIKLRVDKGVGLQGDLDRMQVTFNNTESQVNLAKSNYEVALTNLKNAVGLDANDTLSVKPVEVEKEIVEYKHRLSFNEISLRKDYQLQEVSVKLLDIEQKRLKQAWLPKLSAYGRYSSQAQGEQFSNYTNKWLDFSTIGLKLTFNLFDGFKKSSQYHQAQYNKINADENLKLKTRDFNTEYKGAQIMLTKAKANIVTDQRNIVLADTMLNASTRQYTGGTILLSDYLNSTISRNDAQKNYLTSLYNYLIAKIDLEKAKGNLLNYFNTNN